MPGRHNAGGCRCCCPAGPTFTWNVKGCANQALAGATVTFNGTAYTTNSSGNATITHPGAGTFAYSVAKSRFATQAGNATITCPYSGPTTTLLAATGYNCVRFQCPDPFPGTLHVTDSYFGTTTTVTYVAGSNGRWTGTRSQSITGQVNCLGAATPITITMTYFVDITAVSGPSQITFGNEYGMCNSTPISYAGTSGNTITRNHNAGVTQNLANCAIPLAVSAATTDPSTNSPYQANSTTFTVSE